MSFPGASHVACGCIGVVLVKLGSLLRLPALLRGMWRYEFFVHSEVTGGSSEFFVCKFCGELVLVVLVCCGVVA